MRVAVIADDLTGAADSGVQLARAGYRTAVAFHGSPLSPVDHFDAVAADTDSRALPRAEAGERTARAAGALRGAGLLYKKVDSTLRGPVAAELGAALDAGGRSCGLLAPAFPPAGRTTRNGVQLVDGRPVHETAFADDPTWPVSEARLPALLEAARLGPVEVLPALERPDPERVGRALQVGGWLVADADTAEHLEALVRSVEDPGDVLWAGSAGLAGALGRVHPGPGDGEPSEAPAPEGPALAVIGSAHPVAREQVVRLATEPGVVAVEIDAAALGTAERGADTAHPLTDALERARAALTAGHTVVLHLSASAAAGEGAAARIARGLAGVARELDQARLVGGLVLSGGDTAVAVARALGAHGLVVEDEIEPGVPVGRLLGPRPLPVVTKAGGFGGPDALARACRALAGPSVAAR